MKGGGLYESLLFSGRDSQKFWTAFLSVARRDFNEYASRCFLASWKATTLNGLCWSQREYPPASSWWINPSPGHGLPCRAEDRRGMPRRGVRRSACFWPKEGEQDEIKLRVKLRREMSWKPCKTHGSNLRHLGRSISLIYTEEFDMRKGRIEKTLNVYRHLKRKDDLFMLSLTYAIAGI